jgi:multiple sugar transport system ATP-binding protein
VILGIRPENIHADESFLKSNPKSVVTATIDVTEQMGAEVYLYLEFGSAKLTARVPPGGAYKPGTKVRVGIDTSKTHLFDPDTEGAIRG